jgi:predicted PurR-regulated permease PerM
MERAVLKMPSQAEEPTQLLEPTLAAEQAAERAEVLHTSIKAGTVAQIVVAVIATIGLIYLLKLVLLTTLVSMLLAYVLEPSVSGLALLRIPRSLGALIVVVLALVLTGGLAYFSYNRAVAFSDELPHYTARIRESLGKVLSRANQIKDHTQSIVKPPAEKRAVPVKVEDVQGFNRMISENSGRIFDVLMAISFVPFLVYFMLALKDHFHVATVRLFPKEHRLLAHRTVGSISSMIRTYIAANVVVGLLNAAICTIIFWMLGIKYFYFIGVLSGFLGLIPYLGVFLAMLPPLAGGVDTLDKTGIATVVVAVVALHVVTMNVFYPKFIGERLRLNPLAVSISLLFWAWIWGALGLILAIPILGAAKIIFDHIDPLGGLGTWLGGAGSRLP